MKINYDDYKIFNVLEKEYLPKSVIWKDDLPYCSDDHFNDIKGLYAKFYGYFTKNVNLLTNEFDRNIQDNFDKILDIEGIEEIEESYGTLVDKIGSGACYYINKNHTVIFSFVDGYLASVVWKSDNSPLFYWTSLTFCIVTGVDIEEYTLRYMYNTIARLNFIKHAEVITKHVAPKSTIGTLSRIRNMTKIGCNILDSRWFTTIVRSEGFKVRGHFRFQACGPGMKERKLIYVDDYQKNGYVSIAKKVALE